MIYDLSRSHFFCITQKPHRKGVKYTLFCFHIENGPLIISFHAALGFITCQILSNNLTECALITNFPRTSQVMFFFFLGGVSGNWYVGFKNRRELDAK